MLSTGYHTYSILDRLIVLSYWLPHIFYLGQTHSVMYWLPHIFHLGQTHSVIYWLPQVFYLGQTHSVMYWLPHIFHLGQTHSVMYWLPHVFYLGQTHSVKKCCSYKPDSVSTQTHNVIQCNSQCTILVIGYVTYHTNLIV